MPSGEGCRALGRLRPVAPSNFRGVEKKLAASKRYWRRRKRPNKAEKGLAAAKNISARLPHMGEDTGPEPEHTSLSIRIDSVCR